jgi:hypothetical protein
MMDTQKHIATKPLNQMKIIYDNDVAIIDFISDLKSRSLVLPDLEKQFKIIGDGTACLLYNCYDDDIVVLILYNSPFDFNGAGNTMIMYAENSIRGLIKYFKNQLEHTHPDTGNIYNALNDINHLLYWRWVQAEDENTQSNFIG